VVGGFSLHEELELLVGAGLTNEEALASATRLPAIWLGVDRDRGTIEAGKRADLLLLDADPLIDVANTRRIAGVFLDGKWLSRRTLDGMMADLARRNEATKDQFDWNVMTKQ
jgi:imidazolonepropionase-like amidohydrolase